MSKYTPTTGALLEIYRGYRRRNRGLIGSAPPHRQIEAEFDRFIAGVRAVARREGQAEAWADAIGEAYDCGWIHDYGRDEMIDRNPYETGDRHVDQ